MIGRVNYGKGQWREGLMMGRRRDNDGKGQ